MAGHRDRLLCVVEDAARAGRGLVAVEVPDLDDAVTDLGTRGIRCGTLERGPQRAVR